MRSIFGPKDQAPANRAQGARQRRSQRSQERASSATRRVVTPVRNRPVTSRGNLFGSPIHQQAATRRSRRAFYLTMDQHGGEMRLPTLPFINPGWRLLSGLIAIAAIVGIFSFYNSPFFQIPYVEVLGLQRVTPEEITTELDLENLSIVQVDTVVIMAAISAKFPELMEIHVSVEMPNIVNISAVERQPVLAWRQGEQVTWVDAEGTLFPARGEAGPLVTIDSDHALPLEPLPVEAMIALAETQGAGQDPSAKAADESAAMSGSLAGMLGPGDQKDAAGQPARANLALLSAAQGLSQSLPPETALVYHEANGLGWTEPQGWQVFIGKDLNQFEAKYTLYQTIANHLAEQGLQPSLVSVEHLNAPFYRLEQ